MNNSTSIVKSFGCLRGAALLCTFAVLNCGQPAAPGASLDKAGEAPAQLALSPSNPQIAQGTGQQFSLRGFYSDGRTREFTQEVDWRVTDASGRMLAAATDGLLQVEEPGRYLVTARYGDRTLTTPMVVTAATVTSVAISPTSPRVAKGLTQAFTATATFSDATTQDVTKLATWAVKDVVGTGVATIDTTGVLLAKKARALKDAGLTRLTVSLDGLSESSFQRMSDSAVSRPLSCKPLLAVDQTSDKLRKKLLTPVCTG